jgi:hypothetical protein
LHLRPDRHDFLDSSTTSSNTSPALQTPSGKQKAFNPTPTFFQPARAREPLRCGQWDSALKAPPRPRCARNGRLQISDDLGSSICDLKFAICDPEGPVPAACGLAALADIFFVTIFVGLRLILGAKVFSTGYEAVLESGRKRVYSPIHYPFPTQLIFTIDQSQQAFL